jgi:putative addiction module killer protein
MYTLRRTAQFDAWLAALSDHKAKARIVQRLDAAAAGHWGDCAPVGEGVFEMRIHIGPGYRVYTIRRGTVVYLLLCGGDKSTERRDIRRALALARALPEENQP